MGWGGGVSGGVSHAKPVKKVVLTGEGRGRYGSHQEVSLPGVGRPFLVGETAIHTSTLLIVTRDPTTSSVLCVSGWTL